MVFQKKYFIFTLLNTTCLLHADETVQPSRTQQHRTHMNNIAMILDFHRAAEYRPFDVTFIDFLPLLQEKSFPILISDTVWNSFAQKRNKFAEKMHDQSSYEYAYYTFFMALQKRATFEKEFKTMIENELEVYKLAENPPLPDPAPELVKQYMHLKTLKASLNNYDDVKYGFICYMIFDPDEWESYKYAVAPGSKTKPYELLLLLPKTYINTHSCGLQRNPKHAFTLSNTTDFPLLFASGISDKEDMKKTFAQKPSAQEMYTLLSRIFTTTTTQNLSKCPDLAPWNIFLVGHGSTLPDTAFTAIVDTAQDIVGLEKKLLSLKRPSKISDEEEFEFETGYTKHRIQIFQKELTSLMKQNDSTVASIPVLSFQDGFLSFFSTEVPANFLFILSCYAAGKNMSLLYDIPGRQHTYPFTVATLATTDAAAAAINFTLFDAVNLKAKFLNTENIAFISSNAKISSFFRTLATSYSLAPKSESSRIRKEPSLKPQSYEDIFFYVTAALAGPITNLAAIRYANTPFNHTVYLEKIHTRDTIIDRITYITRLSVAQKYYEKKDIVTTRHTQALMLNTQNIPLTITISSNQNPDLSTPAFISKIPGKAVHYIQKLSAGDKGIDTLSRCFTHANIRQSEKTFVFDSIENTKTSSNNIFKTKHPFFDLLTLAHVIICHNMPNPFDNNDKYPTVSGMLCTYTGKAYALLFDPLKLEITVKSGELTSDETAIYQKLFDAYKTEATAEPIMDIEEVVKFMEKYTSQPEKP